MTAAAENARMLAALMGAELDEAAERLDRKVLVTSDGSPSALAWGSEIVALLERTVAVTTHPQQADVELIIGQAAPRSSAKALFTTIDEREAKVGTERCTAGVEQPHALFRTIAACPVAAAVLHAVIGVPSLPSVPDPLVISKAELGFPDLANLKPLHFTDAVLVGAGAVAHGFLRALRHVPTTGEITILDPKLVGAGNPNRCLYLDADDVGQPKANVLAQKASGDFLHLTLSPATVEFQDFMAGRGPVGTVIVTVDSRRARRSIQKFLPGAVFDASTTDVRGVVVHAHKQPTANACLACIYRHIPDEHARERSIADGLGLELETIKAGFISQEVAEQLATMHAGIDATAIAGKAFDTLFRELCGAQALRTPEGKQVLAPFAFVSALAGALLVLEMLRWAAEAPQVNYWQVDPWKAPLRRLRKLRSRHPECEFCSRPESQSLASSLWGDQRED
ncbi:ThiF family adenylyltransferase [Caulobacter sp.]|uniref:ThiF family adenylyltransferase n=1 Tax=Caulobacter sp. TaxID=78 RepID=UPI003BAB2383